jgi:hypothetical protein
MKTIIAVGNSGGKGKTQTIRELAKLMVKTYPQPQHKLIFSKPIEILEKGDFRLIIEINGKIIGFESQGDPGTGLQKRLDIVISKYKCDLIFCTCRTKGETVKAIKNVASKEYDIIWTSTYNTSKISNHDLLNKIKAKHLLDLVQKLKLI